MDAAKEISVDAAMAEVLSELDSVLMQRTALEAFLGGKKVLALLVTGFW